MNENDAKDCLACIAPPCDGQGTVPYQLRQLYEVQEGMGTKYKYLRVRIGPGSLVEDKQSQSS